ncbi:hypothetical protein [Aliikangiella marina]|uniref:hypothetical protein n=1 Tax=Aliikangiella marina TaxID=1712262 RepID=UPI00163D560A|nr:hypothetical protein [Aliikangiella marina]
MKNLVLLAAIFPLSAAAIDNKKTICKLGDDERIISVVYPQKTIVPCEVQYTKNGTMEVLWRAQAETGFCEEKAAVFIEKQKSWGWTCEHSNPVESREPPKNELEQETISMIAD